MKVTVKGNAADLHVHTTCSDGTLTPAEVVAEAVKAGLKAVAITDHDCVNGIGEAIDASKGTSVEVIPGIEMSAVIEETEIHILGYFIDWRDPELLRRLGIMQERRQERMEKMVSLLRETGVMVDPEKVSRSVTGTTAGRMHLARAIVEENLASDTKEAFCKYIGDGKPCHVRHERTDYRDAIEMIISSGGVPVIAHPGTAGRDEYFDDYVSAGIKGVEAVYLKHRPAVSKRYTAMAEERGLIVTGGSDCHGLPKKKSIIGSVTVPYSTVELLRAAAGKERSFPKGEYAAEK